jgi:hypothetical protein
MAIVAAEDGPVWILSLPLQLSSTAWTRCAQFYSRISFAYEIRIFLNRRPYFSISG